MQSEIQKLSNSIGGLLSSGSIKVSDILKEPTYSKNKHQGVYCIKDASGKVVYVGQTIGGKDGIAQRIWDHANGISELLDVLKVDKKTFRNYSVQSIEEKVVRLRSRIEIFGISVLDSLRE